MTQEERVEWARIEYDRVRRLSNRKPLDCSLLAAVAARLHDLEEARAALGRARRNDTNTSSWRDA